MESPAGVLHVVVVRLPQHEARESRGTHRWLELLPERDDDVLGRGNRAAHEVDVEIEVPVVDAIDDRLLHDVLQGAEIDDVSGRRIDVADDGHIQDVVVSVPVWIVAPAEEALVLLLGERRIVHAMRRVEPKAAGDGDVRHADGREREDGDGRVARLKTSRRKRKRPRFREASLNKRTKRIFEALSNVEVLTTPSVFPALGPDVSIDCRTRSKDLLAQK